MKNYSFAFFCVLFTILLSSGCKERHNNQSGLQENPHAFDSLDDPEIANRIRSRARDDVMRNFALQTSGETILLLFKEAHELIDVKHYDPPKISERINRGINGLIVGLGDSEFIELAESIGKIKLSPEEISNNIRALKLYKEQLKEGGPYRIDSVAHEIYNGINGKNKSGFARIAILELFNSSLESVDRYAAFQPTKTAYGNGASNARLGNETKWAALDEEYLVGIGVELAQHDFGAIVHGVIDGSPAKEAKLKAGDIITEIDGRVFKGKSLSELVRHISGPAGTSMELALQADGKTARIRITRKQFYVSPVQGSRFFRDENIGYLRITKFGKNTWRDLEIKLRKFWQYQQDAAVPRMVGLVVDLRQNPGGLLDEAVAACNGFIRQGCIVSTKEKRAEDNIRYEATKDQTWAVPMVVLVDGNSASASEIFAAAVQKTGRGLVVGRQSYCKGTVQTHFPLRSVAATLKFTTALFCDPNGKEMMGVGVTPDHIVKNDKLQWATKNDPDIAKAFELILNGAALEVAKSHGNPK